MIRLASRRDQDLVMAAVADPEGYDARMAFLIGGVDYAPVLKSCDWGQDGMAIDVKATLGEEPPEELDGETVELYSAIEHVVVPGIVSAKSELEPLGDGACDLIAATAGSLAGGEDAIKLDGFTEFFGMTPDRIGFAAASLLPYDRSQISMAELGNPPLTWAGVNESPGLADGEPVGAIFSRLEEEVGYVFRDTVTRGVRGRVPTPLARGQAPTRSYHARDIPGWKRPARTGPRFYDVRVYRPNPDGSFAFVWRERIPYPHRGPGPLPGQTLDIVIEGADAGDSTAGRTRVVQEALERGRGLYSGSTALPSYDPLLAYEDRLAVAERHATPDHVYERLWLLKVSTYRHSFSAGSSRANSTGGGLGSGVGFQAILVEEERIAVPSLILPGRSSGVLRTA